MIDENRTMSWRVAVVVAALLEASCTKPNPAACCTSESDCAAIGLSTIKACATGLACVQNTCVAASCSSDADCPADHPACSQGLCVDCDASHSCSASEPVCNLDVNTCGPCSTAADCSAFAATPFCDVASGACRGCKLDTECDTGACASDGTCVPESAIIWVATGGVTTGSCTRTAPCASLAYAISQGSPARTHVVMAAGAYPTAIGANSIATNAPQLTIHGGGATLLATGSPAQTIVTASIPVTLIDLTLYGDAIPIDAQATVELAGVTIQSAKHVNVSASLAATDLQVTGGTEIDAFLVNGGATLTLDRAVITRSGAVSGATASVVHLNNVLIWGTAGRALGLSGAGDISFTTITDSGASTGAAPCVALLNPSIQVTSSIMWLPQGCTGAPNGDAAGNGATFVSSIISNATPTPGVTNVDPQFVNPTAHDYHLMATSPAVNAVSTGPAVDLDGTARPQGAAYDIGAYEYKP